MDKAKNRIAKERESLRGRARIARARSVPVDAQPEQPIAPRTHDPDNPDDRQLIGADLDGFLFPGHHRVSGGWDGPDD